MHVGFEYLSSVEIDRIEKNTSAMGSQGGGGQQTQFPNLGRQGSMYSLTLNEVQSQLGEPLYSMNLDELLKNVLPAEGEGTLELGLETNSSHLGSSSSIQRQASVALSKEMCSKTVDEIWRGFQEEDDKAKNERSPAHERQSTLGEMTLEDFLVKAGVVTEGLDKARTEKIVNVGSSGCADSMTSTHGYPPHGIHWLHQYHPMQSLPTQQPQQVQQNMVGNYVPNHNVQQQPQGVGTSGMLDCGYSDTQMTSSSPLMGTLSDTQMPGRKRIAPGDVAEKSVERRQKRMIKNRESAARSRARKQVGLHLFVLLSFLPDLRMISNFF